MFNKKPRRNFRQRKGGSSDEEEQDMAVGDENDNEKSSVVVNRPQKLPQNRGISCSSKREAPPSKSDSSDDDEEEEGDGKELTTKTQNDAGKNKTNTVLSFSEEGGDVDFKLNKSKDRAVLFQRRKKETTAKTQKTPKPSKSLTTSTPVLQKEDSGDDSSSNHDSDDNNGNTVSDSGSNTDDKSDVHMKPGSCSPQSSSGSSHRSGPKQVIIPTAKEIEAAKNLRRANLVKKEYIPLDKDGHSSAASTPEQFSTKDEDEQVENDSDELDDHERRIEFAPQPKSIRDRIAEQMGDSDDSLSRTDEEQELWEEMQIGKGLKRRPGEQSPSESESSSYSSSRPERQRQKNKIPALPDVSIAVIKKRITVKVESLKEVHRAREAEFRRMEGDIENARCSAENLEESSLELELKFYRDMTLYTHNLVECLREKIVEINSLELELHTLLSDQLNSLSSRRRQNVKDQAEHLLQLSYKTNEQTANGKAILGDTALTVKIEEDFDVPEDTMPFPEEEEECHKQMEDILLRSKAVFSDVKDDFYEVKKILSRFEEWRRCYSDSYHNAYISLCLPKLLHSIIRHQLLSWNPLKDTSESFENMPWFTALETFCHGHGHEELEHTDRQTVTSVIEKTLFPKLTAYVEMIWDPMSLHQTGCLADLCHRLKEDYSIFQGERSKPVKAFLDAVASRLRACVDEDIFIPIYPKRFLEDLSSPQCHFREQQFWTAIKLLCIMGKWDLLLPEFVLKELMLDKLLSRYIIIALVNSTGTRLKACKKIAESLPSSWCTGESTCLPQLQSFRNYLVQTVHSVCKQQSPKEPSTKSAVTEILKILSRVRCYDSIMTIAEKYHYEDAIYTHQLINQDAV
ncbi:GC-rich sequence DNA-binding factor 2 isoform X2 [Boleophthalmus pectinirostris]|uniref:GC-rich sequence DNA-binding factor 2 isoform X2 n=1 Tax=Boleophthalmus pectinirostris TaxID=150288 RepID=UPI0024314A6D|nr:GC-rich sequence DNA-binding factor 2 isoform X2 [Boleophthalmus pectinirostris]